MSQISESRSERSNCGARFTLRRPNPNPPRACFAAPGEALTIGVEVLVIQLRHAGLTRAQVGAAVLQAGSSVGTRPAVAARRLGHF